MTTVTDNNNNSHSDQAGVQAVTYNHFDDYMEISKERCGVGQKHWMVGVGGGVE
jgi:hypothetical protein